MAIENIYTPLLGQLPAIKSIEDYQDEAINRQAKLAQLGNYNLESKANQLKLDEALRQQNLINQDKALATKYIADDGTGNKTLDTQGYLNERYTLDPIGTFKLASENAKTVKDLKNTDLETQIKKADLQKKQLDNLDNITNTSLNFLGSVTDLPTLQQAQIGASQYINGLEIPTEQKIKLLQGVQSWNLNNLDAIKSQGLSLKDQLELKRNELADKIKGIELEFSRDRNQRESTKFNQEQQGILPPAEVQKAVKTAQDQIQTIKNANKIDEAEQAYSSVASLFGRKKDGKLGYRGNRDSTGLADVNLIIGSNRVINPGNQVTIQEGKVTSGTEGMPERFVTLINQALSGKSLSDAQRFEIFDIVQKNIQGKRKALDTAINPIINQATNLNLPIDQIFTPTEIKRNKLDINSKKVPNSPFSFNANTPPPAYTGQPTIATNSGQVVPLGTKPFTPPNVGNPNQTQPTLALPSKFTDLSMEQRKAIQTKAKAKGYTPQEYFNLLRGS